MPKKSTREQSDDCGKLPFNIVWKNDFENMVSKSFDYPKGLNGTMEIVFNLETNDDVDKEYKRLIDLNVESVLRPTTLPWGQRTCIFADPEGNIIEIGCLEECKLNEK